MTTPQKIFFGLSIAVTLGFAALMGWAVVTTPADRPR